MFHENNMFREDSIEVQAYKCTKFSSSHPRNYLMRRKQNISSHAVGQRSQSNDNFTSHFEEVSQIPDNFDSQTYTNVLQESSVLGSFSLHRQLNEHYQPNHHNFQVPTDQFVMNRPDVAPTSRHVFVDPITNRLNLPREIVEQEHRQSMRDHPRLIRPTPYRLYDPRYAAIGLPVDPLLRAFKQNPNFSKLKATSDESSTTNNTRTVYARSRVPMLHQSSSHSGREVVDQEHRQNRRDHPRLIRPTPYRLYDPRYAAIGLPVDPLLRAFKQNPNFSKLKATSDESSTTNNTRREVVEQEHTQNRRDHPRLIRPILNSLYDPRYAAIGLPVDPILRAFKQNPNFSKLKATSGESSTTNNIRNHYALSRVPGLHQSSSHSGREVVEQEHAESRGDYPRVIRRIPNRLYDPRYDAAIGLPVDPLLRAFKLNPNFGLSKRDK